MTGLVTDPRRQANDALRGYVYQIARSVLAWLELGDTDELYLEGAEDLDRIDAAGARVDQVKDTAGSGNITLRTASVIEAINNYWSHTDRNPDVAIRFRYVTTSTIGVERGAPFGKGRGGLAAWNALRATPDGAAGEQQVCALARFLANTPELAPPIKAFLAAAPPAQILSKLIVPIEWLAGQQESSILVRQIKDSLVLHGDRTGVPPADAEQVFDALYVAAFDAAKAKDAIPLTRADFLRIFSGATAIQVQKQDFLALIKGALQPGAAVGRAIRASLHVLEGAPPIPARYFRRDEIERQLAALARDGAVVLYGSTGSGKTLMTASSFADQAPAWLTFRDLSPTEAKTHLVAAGNALRSEGRTRTIVVDDINAFDDPRPVEAALAALWRCQKSLGGQLIVTTDRPLPARLAQAVEIDATRELQLLPFDTPEIEAFLRQEGCPQECIQTWAKLLELSTLGHPQLVSARITTLAAGQFPLPGPEDLVKTPPDVDRIRFEARRLIADLSDGPRELLYRASLLTGRVTRERLMTIARFEEAIAEPGNAVDQIVGPWLELTNEGDYRVSPLARGSAEQARGQDWARAMHGKLAWAYLVGRTLTPWDISSVLMHCFIAGSAGPLVRILQSIMGASEEVWTQIAEACDIYAKLALGPNDRLPFARPADLFVFRLFQYRIAAQSAPEVALQIAAKTEAEFKATPPDDATRFFRFLYLSQVLSVLKVRYPIGVVVEQAAEFFEIARALEESLPKRMADARMPDTDDIEPGSYVQFAAFRLFAHIQEIDDLAALVASIDARDTKDAAAMLKSLADSDDMASVLIERLWLAEYQAKRSRWAQFRTTLRRAFDAAARLKVDSMARAIAPVLVRTIDEDIADPAGALTEAEALSAVVGEDPIFQCALAKVVHHAGDTSRAVALWEKFLPKWPNAKGDFGAAFARRSAAIAASKIDRWDRAAAFLSEAARDMAEAGNPTFVLGLRMDSALCTFLAGARPEAIVQFGGIVAALEPLQPDLEREPLLSLQRRAGGVLSAIGKWIDGTLTTDELTNLVAICSNLDPFETEAKVAPPLDGLRMDLIKVELAHGGTTELSLRQAPQLRRTPFVSFQGVIAEPLFALATRTLDFAPVVADGLRQLDALAAMAEQLEAEDRDPMRHADGKQRDWPSGADNLLLGRMASATFALAAASELDRLPIQQWRRDAAEHANAAKVAGLIDHLEGLFVTGEIGPWSSVMQCTSGQWTHHLVSALAATILERLTPGVLLQCHGLWAHYLAQPIFHDLTAQSVEQLVTQQWAAAMAVPALFVAPRTSLPRLQAAIDEEACGWVKSRSVLCAAFEAVGLRNNGEVRRAIEGILP